jgi:hypothetical protein
MSLEEDNLCSLTANDVYSNTTVAICFRIKILTPVLSIKGQ